MMAYYTPLSWAESKRREEEDVKDNRWLMTSWKHGVKEQPRTGRDGSGEENNRWTLQNVKNLLVHSRLPKEKNVSGSVIK